MSVDIRPARFDDKVLSAQSTFRAIMDATARPGRIRRVAATTDAPAPMMAATAALAQALFDHDTPVWRDAAMRSDDVAQWLRFHTGAPLTHDGATAAFALIGDVAALPELAAFSFGSGEYPDRSTTLIVQVDTLAEGVRHDLRGPGIDGSIVVTLDTRLRGLIAALAINETSFPCGIDIVLVAGDEILAIPRTTRIRAMEG